MISLFAVCQTAKIFNPSIPTLGMFTLCISVDCELLVQLQLHHTHSHQLLFSKKNRKTDPKHREIERERDNWEDVLTRRAEREGEQEGGRATIVDELAFPVAAWLSEALRKEQDC